MTARPYNIDLSAHLAECDGNYLRLIRLMPVLKRAGVNQSMRDERLDFRIALGTDAPTVTLRVIDRRPYTSVVTLLQRSVGHGVQETRMKVRLYHDARSAEVIEFQGQRLFEPVYAYPNPKMRQPDEKAQVNRFLREFLNACLTHGVAKAEPAPIES